MTSVPEPDRPPSSSSFSTLIHVVVIGLLVGGGAAYWFLKSPSVDPMADPLAAQAMALVQTHRAQGAPTLLHAITDRVQAMVKRGQGVRLGEWRVQHQQGDLYLVSIMVREEGTRQWFEREYLWQVDVGRRMIQPLGLPAESLMPINTDSSITSSGPRP